MNSKRDKALARHYNVPLERASAFAAALAALAEDARADTPRWLPAMLGKEGGAPGTAVTETSLYSLPDIPKVAPELWVPRGEELPEDFAVRVYGQWMKPDNTGITTADILHLDAPLYNALRRSPRTEKPEGFYLPSKGERNRAIVGLIKEGKLPMPQDYRTRTRLATAAAKAGQSLVR